MRYSYDRLWGSLALVGSFFAGEGDGGKVVADGNATPVTNTPAPPLSQSNLQAASGAPDAPRIFPPGSTPAARRALRPV